MDELLELVRDSNYYEFESVSSVTGHTGSRAERLLEHIRDTKHTYWTIIAKKLRLEAPPQTLEALMAYELEQTAQLSQEARATLVSYGKKMTVSALIRLCCRHSLWHAGQIALTKMD